MTDNPAEQLAVEVYRDIARPAAQEVGGVLGRVIALVLRPIKDALDRSEERRTQIARSVAERLASVPEERIVEPVATIAGPAMQAAVFAADDDVLREMYAKLLATSMDREVLATAHPAFVQIITQLMPDEARLMRLFGVRQSATAVEIGIDGSLFKGGGPRRTILPFYSSLAFSALLALPEGVEGYTDNLVRLGLVRRYDPAGETLVTNEPAADDPLAEVASRVANLLCEPAADRSSGDDYQDAERDLIVRDLTNRLAAVAPRAPDAWFYRRRLLQTTEFGRRFCAACVDLPAAGPGAGKHW